MTSKTKSVTCEICNKTFLDSDKGYKAKYYYEKHKINCFRLFNKKKRKIIKEFSLNANDYQINRVYEFIKNPQDFYTKVLSPEPISMSIRNLSPKQPSPSPSPTPPPSCSTASDLDEWDYQNVCYFVDNKNRVCDEYGNEIGHRFKDELSSEYRLEYT